MASSSTSRLARLSLEGVVIVVSILLAFGIDAWWGERQERKRMLGQLTQVEIDLRSTLQNLTDYGINAERARLANRSLVEARNNPEAVPVDSAGAFFAWSWILAGGEPRIESVRSLVQTGEIGLLEDPELQQAMTMYLARIQEADRYENEVLEQFGATVLGLFEYIDLTDVVTATLSSEELGQAGLTWEAHSPEYDRGLDRRLINEHAHSLITNAAVQRILSQMLALKTDVRLQQIAMRAETEALLERVEAVPR